MNTPNPLMPQGSLDESKPKSRNNVYIAVFAILAFHVVLLGALLLQGCKDNRNIQVASKPSVLDPMNTQPVVSNSIPTDPFTQPNQVGVVPTTPVIPAPVVTPVAPPPVINPAPVAEMAPLAPAPAIAAPAVQEHIVAKGDSFSTMSKKYGVSPQAIAKANPGVDSKKLKIGAKVKIPEKSTVQVTTASGVTKIPGGSDLTFGNGATATASSENVYVVKPGDNLSKIVKRTGVSAKQIKLANNLPTDMIRVGQKLKIPSKTAAAAPVIEAAPVAPAVPAISPEPAPTPMIAPVRSGTT